MAWKNGIQMPFTFFVFAWHWKTDLNFAFCFSFSLNFEKRIWTSYFFFRFRFTLKNGYEFQFSFFVFASLWKMDLNFAFRFCITCYWKTDWSFVFHFCTNLKSGLIHQSLKLICNFLLSRILWLQVVKCSNVRHFPSPSRICKCCDSCLFFSRLSSYHLSSIVKKGSTVCV